tara:strand:- start:7305 stop:7595 length:291 start_codon:yes stop_codon:yes gene_type:complete
MEITTRQKFIVKNELDDDSATIIRLKTAIEECILDDIDIENSVFGESYQSCGSILEYLLCVCKEHTRDTSYICGRGGHHIWVANKNYKRVLFIKEV